MEILTGEQMRHVDRHAIDELGVPGLTLMEAAGRGVAEALLEDVPHIRSHRLIILCGKGNNGGDGLVAARHLLSMGASPRVLLFARADELKGDAAINHRAALASGVEVEEILDAGAWASRSSILARGTTVLDALLGTGVRGGARGLLKDVIDTVNRSEASCVAVDLPSGLDADSGEVHGSAVRADRTYTLCRPKLPLVAGPASEYSRTWRVIPIGIPDVSVATVENDLEWLDRDALSGLLERRSRAAHKGTYGHLLAVAGARGKAGAAVLLGRGALCSGAGLVSIATPESVRAEVAVQQAELMTEGLPETENGTVAGECVPRVLSMLSSRQALALGPGIGTHPETRQAVLGILEGTDRPVVVDADGLNSLAEAGPGALERLARPGRSRVLTPHPGEAARLLGCGVPEVQADRLGHARTLARLSGAVVVLKGAGTVIAAPDGRAAVNSSGNPGMATAGTGDVLTGMIGAFLARGLSPLDSARLGVFAHGLAGDLAAEIRGQEGLLASDVIGAIPAALEGLVDGAARVTPWICRTSTAPRRCSGPGPGPERA